MKNKIFLFSLIIFAVSFGARIWNISGLGATADETSWMDRGNHYVESIAQGKFRQASSSRFGAHPGITTAILAGVSQKIFKNCFEPLTAARLPLIFVNSLTPLLVFWFLARLKKPGLGFLAALILALDPFHISLSRIVHVDALLTFFTSAALFCYFLAEKEKKEWLKILAGIFFGFAILTKLLAVSAILIILVYKIILSIKKRRLQISSFDFLALFVGLLVFYLFFTKLWLHPFTGIIDHIRNNFEGELAKGHSNFFLGEISFAPSKLFYFVVLPLRLSEITLIFFIAGFLLSLKKIWRNNLYLFLAIWLIVIFGLLSSQSKMGDRYLLPVWPAIAILAAFGLQKVLNFIKNEKIKMAIAAGLIFFGSIFYIIKYSPNYYFFYNSLVGGAEGAKRITVVGRGEGHKELVQYFKGKKNKVGFLGDDALVKFYDQSAKFERLPADFEPQNYDFIAIYTSAEQRLNHDLKIAEYLKDKMPYNIIKLNNVSVFKIYSVK